MHCFVVVWSSWKHNTCSSLRSCLTQHNHLHIIQSSHRALPNRCKYFWERVPLELVRDQRSTYSTSCCHHGCSCGCHRCSMWVFSNIIGCQSKSKHHTDWLCQSVSAWMTVEIFPMTLLVESKGGFLLPPTCLTEKLFDSNLLKMENTKCGLPTEDWTGNLWF